MAKTKQVARRGPRPAMAGKKRPVRREVQRRSRTMEVLKIGDDDSIRVVRRLRPQQDDDSESEYCEDEEPASPGYPQVASDVQMTPAVALTRSMARLHQPPPSTSAPEEEAHPDSSSDDDKPLRRNRRPSRQLLEPSLETVKAKAPSKGVAPAQSGVSKKSPKKKGLKNSNAKTKPLREVTEEHHLERLRSVIDEELLVPVERKLPGTTKPGRMYVASWQMIDRLQRDRNTASGDVIRLEKEVMDLKKRLEHVKKALK
ncbi:hypothetical protein PV08_03396 [Exophiala spinifera]|uniref:Uncharacterized protein n=1 Tax=Exophiala spinifera TaxID=91928 RepID=A0A0D2C6B9_9EURO|nr:uncharacterized protein PV08_03396 [Exophiala spinifera]KIW19104.1 hypothetical protein PV08_03396 [Exophiala spinifera]